MSETPADCSAHSPSNGLPVVLLHAAQLLPAVILLGLDAYGVSYIEYKGLVYALFVAICTILVCSYFIACLSKLMRFYSTKVALGLNVFMIIFWLADIGLIASLAKDWKQPQSVSMLDSGHHCSGDGKCDLQRIDHTSPDTYSGALVAGAVLAGLEVMLWIVTTGLLLLDIRKQLASHEDTSSSRMQPTTAEPTQHPPRRTEPWEDYNTAPGPAASRTGPEPILPESVDDDDYAFSHYPQSPVSVEEDSHYVAPRHGIVPNFRPLQAPQRSFDPYVKGMVIHQVPDNGGLVEADTAQSPQFQAPSSWHVVN